MHQALKVMVRDSETQLKLVRIEMAQAGAQMVSIGD